MLEAILSLTNNFTPIMWLNSTLSMLCKAAFRLLMSFAPGYERTSNPMLGAPVGCQGDDDVGLGSESSLKLPAGL